MQKRFQNFTRKVFINAKPFLKLPIIWLAIIFEFILKIPSYRQFQKRFCVLNTFLVNFWILFCIDYVYLRFSRVYQKISYRRKKSFSDLPKCTKTFRVQISFHIYFCINQISDFISKLLCILFWIELNQTLERLHPGL